MTFDPTSVEVTCVTLPKDHCVHVPWEYTYVCGYSDQFCELSNKGHWPTSVEVLCVTLPKDHSVQVPWKSSMWIQWPFLQKKNMNQRSLKIRVNNNKVIKQGGSGTMSLAWKYIKVCGYSDRFCKNLNQRSLTPRWPLTPHLLRSYV